MPHFTSLLFLILFSLVTSIGIAQKPKATIISPVNKSYYIGNQDIIFKGTGTDATDGQLPASAFRWLVHMNHGKDNAQHWHDGIGLYDDIKEGMFSTPSSDDHVIADSIFFRFFLIVTNSKGISDTSSVDIIPKQTKLILTTEPSGLNINIQGNGLLVTPLIASPTQNMIIPLSAPKNQTLNGKTYTFKEWSDGQKNSSIIITSSGLEMSLKAIYTAVNAVNEKLNMDVFKVYPNPVQEIINIEADPKYLENINIQIFNISGKQINSNVLAKDNSHLSINTGTFTSGLYIIKINTDKGYTLYPFSKQ